MTIDEYLDRLCAALQVEPLRRDEIRLETHCHLREQSDIYLRRGMTPEDAEARAVGEFGPPHHLADQLSASHPSAAPWNVSRHIQNIGLLLVGYSLHAIVRQIILFSVLSSDKQFTHILQFTMFLGLSYGPYLLLGWLLFQEKIRARWPLLLLTLFNPLALIILAVCIGDYFFGLEEAVRFTLSIFGDGVSALIFIGCYAAWVYRQSPKQNRVTA